MGHGDQNLNLPGGLNFEPDPKRVRELMKLIGGSAGRRPMLWGGGCAPWPR